MKARYAYPVLLASGAVLSLAFPEPDVAPLAWVAVVPLLVVARGETMGRGFLAGYVFGLGFFGALLTWISMIGWIGWLLLVLLQALFLGAFGLAWAFASRRASPVENIIAAGALWIAVDYLRSIVPVVGFTWGQLAQSQHNLGWMLRPAALGGGWLVTFIVVAVNALLASALSLGIQTAKRRRLAKEAGRSRWRGSLVPLAVAIAVIAAPFLLPKQDATGDSIDVAIVQGNVPLEIPRGFERDLAILASHRELTEELADERVDLVVWPESAIPLDIERNLEVQVALESAAQSVNAPIVAGGHIDAGPDNYKVMAFEISPLGQLVDRYQKTHLVPFGEYVPARALFDWIPMLDQVERDAVPGDEVKVFEAAGGPVAPVVSFEGDFGSLVRRRMDAGGRVLTVLTNTSTWGETWASAQHVAFSQVRAAENGVWVVHAAISGLSAFIAPDGSVVQRIPLWTADNAVQQLNFAEDTTFYARFGDWVPLLSALLSAFVLGTAARGNAAGSN